jgi:transaldolase/glucose-6-phosphate isomerase
VNPLTALVAHGQSPWLDFVRRDMLTDGRLAEMVERDGLRGVTSNPAIFQKALAEGVEYEPALAELVAGDPPGAAELYEALAAPARSRRPIASGVPSTVPT